jgi:stringent starvation protein B
MSETSTKPYLLRAIYEWCTDNGYTPYLAVSVDSQTRVPREFVKNGEIVLNIGFTATSGLKLDNDFIHFSARFGGVSREIVVPVENVSAIYARESGQGMAFEVAGQPDAEDAKLPAEDEHPVSVTPPILSAVPAAQESNEDNPESDPDNEPNPPKKGKRPTLTRVK